MCGRYSLTVKDPFDLRARFPIGESVEVRPRYNIAPTDEVLAVTTTREGEPRGENLRWGLIPPWSADPRGGAKTINARAETVAEKPAYREAFRRYRCLIPADGFYEWQRATVPKQAFRITRADHEMFAFAGLWSQWRSPDGERIVRSCTIITTEANERVAAVHNRMPVILTREQEDHWLDPGTPPEILHGLLRGLPSAAVELTPVSEAVNSVRNDGPECLLPPTQPALF